MQPERPPQVGVSSGLVLCGGASRRMGTDKALLQLEGRALIEYPLAALAELGVAARLACGTQPRYAQLGCELVLDGCEDGGPLAGLTAGLEAAASAGETWVWVLACDMPRVRADVLRALLEEASARDLDACLLELPRGSQPTYAVYHVRCATAARAALSGGERRMVAFHEALRVGTLAAEGREASALNINTRAEFDSLQDGSQGGAR